MGDDLRAYMGGPEDQGDGISEAITYGRYHVMGTEAVDVHVSWVDHGRLRMHEVALHLHLPEAAVTFGATLSRQQAVALAEQLLHYAWTRPDGSVEPAHVRTLGGEARYPAVTMPEHVTGKDADGNPLTEPGARLHMALRRIFKWLEGRR
jgi:hypothetical protein